MRKRILVTGGCGFLGSHLCERLLEAGHDVLCVDNFFTGSKSNIEHLIGHLGYFNPTRFDSSAKTLFLATSNEAIGNFGFIGFFWDIDLVEGERFGFYERDT